MQCDFQDPTKIIYRIVMKEVIEVVITLVIFKVAKNISETVYGIPGYYSVLVILGALGICFFIVHRYLSYHKRFKKFLLGWTVLIVVYEMLDLFYDSIVS